MHVCVCVCLTLAQPPTGGWRLCGKAGNCHGRIPEQDDGEGVERISDSTTPSLQHSLQDSPLLAPP